MIFVWDDQHHSNVTPTERRNEEAKHCDAAQNPDSSTPCALATQFAESLMNGSERPPLQWSDQAQRQHQITLQLCALNPR